MKKEMKVTKSDEALVDVLNIIAEDITNVAAAFEAVKKSKLKEETIIILLKARLPNISKADIKAVLEEAAGLKSTYVKAEIKK